MAEEEEESIESQNILFLFFFRLHQPRFNIVYFRLPVDNRIRIYS